MNKSSEFANVYQVVLQNFAPFNGPVKFTKKKCRSVGLSAGWLQMQID